MVVLDLYIIFYLSIFWYKGTLSWFHYLTLVLDFKGKAFFFFSFYLPWCMMIVVVLLNMTLILRCVQYSYLENSMNRWSWQATGHRAIESEWVHDWVTNILGEQLTLKNFVLYKIIFLHLLRWFCSFNCHFTNVMCHKWWFT